jgi:two-component sensor histidine kinase
MHDFAATADVYVTLPTQQNQSAGSETEEFLLLREMHHRMANTLTLLAAQLWKEFRSSKASQVRGSLVRFEARIAAFGDLHRLLAVGAGNRPIDVGRYVEALCHLLSEAVLRPLGICCEVSVDDGVLPGRTCERLGLIIAELVTNAAKHAFTDLDGGLVRVEMSSEPGRWLCTVSDNGTGIGMRLANSGTRILDEIAQMVGGTLVLRSGTDGTSVTVAFSSEPIDAADPPAIGIREPNCEPDQHATMSQALRLTE